MRRRISYVFLAVALFTAGVQAACSDVPSQYSAEAIEAWVVDAETKKPVEGAIVVAHWQLETGLFHTVDVGQMKIFETLTDENGRFAFPAWGPEPREGHGVLITADPEILIFKDGYIPFHFRNMRMEETPERHPIRRSQLNGRIVDLKPVGAEYTERLAESMLALTDRLRFATGKRGNAECLWKKIPRMMVAVYEQQQIVNKHTIAYHTDFLTNLPRSECGWAKEYFADQIDQ